MDAFRTVGDLQKPEWINGDGAAKEWAAKVVKHGPVKHCCIAAPLSLTPSAASTEG